MSACQPSFTTGSTTGKRIAYEKQLCQLLDDLSAFNLTGDIFGESAYSCGRGGYGDVFTGRSRRHGNITVAVKRLRIHILPENRFAAKILLRELEIWSRVQHPNCLPLLGYVIQGSSPCPALVSPWMVKGSVRKFMEKNPETAVAYLAKGISKGLLYLHNNQIVHSDLKCDNIFLSDSGEPLLADFGISRCLTTVSNSDSPSSQGSARWLAVEFFLSALDGAENSVKHSKETDVWAFGMVLYELLSGLVPFPHLKNDLLVSVAILKGATPTRPPSVCSEEDQSLLWSISQACWRKHPASRPEMLTILKKLHGIDDFTEALPADLSELVTQPSSDGSRNLQQDLRRSTVFPSRIHHEIILAKFHIGSVDSPVATGLLNRRAHNFISYDLRFPLDYGLSSRDEIPGKLRLSTLKDLLQPATSPPRPSLFVKAPYVYPPGILGCPGECDIRVFPSFGETYVTVRDVLQAIHKAFHSPANPKAVHFLQQNDPVHRGIIIDAFEKRCSESAMRLKRSIDEERLGGNVCLDWFGEDTYFGGLALSKADDSYRNVVSEVWEFDLIHRRGL